MEDLRSRGQTLGRSLTLLAVYAALIGTLSVVLNLGDALSGEVPAIVRALLGLWGVAASLLLWTGRRAGIDGWRAVMLWSVLQIPLYAWNADGSPFVQVLEVPLSFTSQTTVNGEVTSFSEIGINLVGVALAAWTASTRERWTLRGLRPTPLAT